MIPKYPFSVTIEYQARVKRQAVNKSFETLGGATAMYHENIGRQDVRRVTISLIIDQSERWEQPSKKH